MRNEKKITKSSYIDMDVSYFDDMHAQSLKFLYHSDRRCRPSQDDLLEPISVVLVTNAWESISRRMIEIDVLWEPMESLEPTKGMDS